MAKVKNNNYVKFGDKAMYRLIKAQKLRRLETLGNLNLLPVNDSPGYIKVRKEPPALPTLNQCDIQTIQRFAAVLGAKLLTPVAVKE